MREKPDPAQLGEPEFSLDAKQQETTSWTRKIWNRPAGVRNAALLVKPSYLLPFPMWGDARKHDAITMLASAPDLDSEDGTQWVPVKLLGMGALGSVGLWQLRDLTDKTVDAMAIKQQYFDSNGKSQETDGEDLPLHSLGIEKEAVFTVGLQQKYYEELKNPDRPSELDVDKDSHMIHLRRYRYHQPMDACRMYMPHAQFSTLEELQRRYWAFNQWIPEPFLVVLFHSLTSAVKIMDGPLLESAFLYQYRGAGEHPRPRKPDDFVLHADIKPTNILLDYSALTDEELNNIYKHKDYPRDLSIMYPRVILTDLGLVQDYNPSMGRLKTHQFGTPGYLPPEQIDVGWAPTTRQLKDPPNRRAPQLTISHSVWAVAKIIFDCMAGHSAFHVNFRFEAMTQQVYDDNNGHILAEDWHTRPEEHVKHYSKQLCDLVRDCLHIRVSERPSLDEILRRTTAMLKKLGDEVGEKPADERGAYRLFFRPEENDDLPVGGKCWPPLRTTEIEKDLVNQLRQRQPPPTVEDVEVLRDDRSRRWRQEFLQVRYADPEFPVKLPYALWAGVYEDPGMMDVDPYPKKAEIDGDGNIDFGGEDMAATYVQRLGVERGLLDPKFIQGANALRRITALRERNIEDEAVMRQREDGDGEEVSQHDEDADQDNYYGSFFPQGQRLAADERAAAAAAAEQAPPAPAQGAAETDGQQADPLADAGAEPSQPGAVQNGQGRPSEGEDEDGHGPPEPPEPPEPEGDDGQKHQDPNDGPGQPSASHDRSPTQAPAPPQQETLEDLLKLSMKDLRSMVFGLNPHIKRTGKGADKKGLAQVIVDIRAGRAVPEAMLKKGAGGAGAGAGAGASAGGGTKTGAKVKGSGKKRSAREEEEGEAEGEEEGGRGEDVQEDVQEEAQEEAQEKETRRTRSAARGKADNKSKRAAREEEEEEEEESRGTKRGAKGKADNKRTRGARKEQGEEEDEVQEEENQGRKRGAKGKGKGKVDNKRKRAARDEEEEEEEGQEETQGQENENAEGQRKKRKVRKR